MADVMHDKKRQQPGTYCTAAMLALMAAALFAFVFLRRRA